MTNGESLYTVTGLEDAERLKLVETILPSVLVTVVLLVTVTWKVYATFSVILAASTAITAPSDDFITVLLPVLVILPGSVIGSNK